jgi:hypothetical protein
MVVAGRFKTYADGVLEAMQIVGEAAKLHRRVQQDEDAPG